MISVAARMSEPGATVIARALAQRRLPVDAKILARFWSYVAIGAENDCWIWTGGKFRGGYGCAWNGERQVSAHRLSWTIHHGAEPGELDVLHRCDNPPCVNPTHLFLGTDTDNMRDMTAKGRNRPQSLVGTANPSAKLTEALVLQIRHRVATGELRQDVAAELGVSHARVSSVCLGQTWKHVGGPLTRACAPPGMGRRR